MTQDQLGCITANEVSPVYPRKARLAGIQGEGKLLLVIDKHNEVVELDVVSGDPPLVKSAVKAVRQWEFLIGGYVGPGPTETEVPLTFTFKVEDPPKPALLELVNGKINSRGHRSRIYRRHGIYGRGPDTSNISRLRQRHLSVRYFAHGQTRRKRTGVCRRGRIFIRHPRDAY